MIHQILRLCIFTTFDQDHDRRLVINNIDAALDLVCIMRNTVNGKDRENQELFYITLKNKTKSSAIEFINDRKNQSSVTILKPNQVSYHKFIIILFMLESLRNKLFLNS